MLDTNGETDGSSEEIGKEDIDDYNKDVEEDPSKEVKLSESNRGMSGVT